MHMEHEPDWIHGNGLDLTLVAGRNRTDRRFALHSDTLSRMGVSRSVNDLRRFSYPTCGDSISEGTLVRCSAQAADAHCWAGLLTGAIVIMLRSIVFIKSVHTAIFVVMSGALVVIFYQIVVDQIMFPIWIV